MGWLRGSLWLWLLASVAWAVYRVYAAYENCLRIWGRAGVPAGWPQTICWSDAGPLHGAILQDVIRWPMVAAVLAILLLCCLPPRPRDWIAGHGYHHREVRKILDL